MNNNLRTFDDLITELYGERGNPNRERFERGKQRFKAEYLHDMKTYRGAFVRIPGEVVRYSPLSVKRMINRLSLLVRLKHRKRMSSN